MLLGVFRRLQRVQGVGSPAGWPHYQAGFGGLAAQRFRELIGGLARASGAFGALLGGIRAQQVSPAFNSDVKLLGQLVDPLQADVAPGSNVVVPDCDPNRRFFILPVFRFFRHNNAPLGQTQWVRAHFTPWQFRATSRLFVRLLLTKRG